MNPITSKVHSNFHKKPVATFATIKREEEKVPNMSGITSYNSQY